MDDGRPVTTAPIQPPVARVATWLAPLLFSIAIVGEILSFVLMTVYRYRSQLLTPEFFDLAKTGNLLGFLFEAPFILLFLTLLLVRRFHTIGLSVTAAIMALVGLGALWVAPMFPVSESTPYYTYTGYLTFMLVKALELGIFFAILSTGARSVWRTGLNVIVVAAALMLANFAFVIITVLVSPIGSTTTEQPQREYDAGVILGAAVWSGDRPSPVLRERINKGYDLLKSGAVQFLVLTGGKAPNELPEAEVARRELLKRGTDPTRIVSETRTSSTLEQILYIRDQLQKKQGWRSFIIISDQFHLKRALEICAFNEIDAVGVSSESPLGPQNLALHHLRESGALILYWLFGI